LLQGKQSVTIQCSARSLTRYALALELFVILGVRADPIPQEHSIVGKFAERTVADANAHRPVVTADFLEMQ
jgi:hypothetical protein